VYVFDPPPKHVYRERVAHDIYAVRHELNIFWRVPRLGTYAVNTGVEFFMASAVYMVGHIDTRNSTLAVLCLPYIYKVFRF